jgi:hypothetical protein
LEYSEFRCRWIEPRDLWDIADETRKKYWPEAILPVNTEEIVEFRLRLDIEPVKYFLSTIDIDAYCRKPDYP